jgi:hypothetical protein
VVQPQSEHANVSANIDHRIVVLQLETRMGVLPALKVSQRRYLATVRIAVEVK